MGMSSDTEVIRILADMGVFFLMFHAGLDTNARELYSRAKVSIAVCIGGIIPLFSLSYFILSYFEYSLTATLFMSAVLSLNSIPVIVSVLKKFNLKKDKVGHTVLGASVANELSPLYSRVCYYVYRRKWIFFYSRLSLHLYKGNVIFCRNTHFRTTYPPLFF